MSNKRLDFLDYAKGIGILLVVLAHIYCFNSDINRGIVTTWIYSFHMPLFFIISGMLLRYKNTKLKKISIFKIAYGILLPYILFSIITIIVKELLYGFSIKLLVWDSLYTITGLGLDVLWFLPALFIGETFFLVLNRYIKNEYVKLGLITVIFIGATFITRENSVVLIVLARSIIALGFIAVGYYLYKLIANKEIRIIYLIGLLIVQVISAKINGFVDLNNLVFNNRLLYLINSIIGSIIIINLCKKIKRANILSYFGKNSIVVMGMHMNLIAIYISLEKFNLFSYTTGIILLIGLLVVEIPIIYIYNNIMKKFNFIKYIIN